MPDTIARQWEMLRLIPRHPAKKTATEIHEGLVGGGYEVTKRTVERDLLDLTRLFPLQADERSRPFGWSWSADAPGLTIPGLSLSQALTFQLVQQHLRPLLPPAALAELDPYFRLAAARLSEMGPRRSWADKVRVVAPMQALLVPPLKKDVQKVLYEALLADRQVKIRYLKAGEKTPVDYDAVHPLGLVQRGAVLYLVCTFYGYQDPFLLVLHRMKAVEMLAAPVSRPAGFDIDAYIASGQMGFGNGKMVHLELLLEADAARHLAETPLSTNQRLTPMPDGRIRIQATLPETEQLRWWILGFGEKAEVIRPRRMRSVMIVTAQRLAALYGAQ
ncbi:WYL domain-containing protein [Acidiferrobacter sp.]|uniref:helix-turn-helix transcriptional regulator n=1 Tax=Acidiferrobacter sp. TaxID=1872107 RepID=UPI00260C7B8A|nr:WYL domain-containing protein [Acidiferrobacter sp.]